jgi:hypothetical protein
MDLGDESSLMSLGLAVNGITARGIQDISEYLR